MLKSKFECRHIFGRSILKYEFGTNILISGLSLDCQSHNDLTSVLFLNVFHNTLNNRYFYEYSQKLAKIVFFTLHKNTFIQYIYTIYLYNTLINVL